MPKGTMLDRLAGEMKTLGKREGKTLKTKYPSRAFMQTKGPKAGLIKRFRYDPRFDGYVHLAKGPDGLWWEAEYEPLQGPDLPRDIERYRQQMLDAIESGNASRITSRTRAYEDAWAMERARQAYNQKLIEDEFPDDFDYTWRY